MCHISNASLSQFLIGDNIYCVKFCAEMLAVRSNTNTHKLRLSKWVAIGNK